MPRPKLNKLLKEIRACDVCAHDLPLGPRPIVAAHASAKIVIIGQAPGVRVHKSGVPWDDASGKRLREWLGVSDEEFYDERRIAMMPMGFCYPGTGSSGDLPPRPECADLWHEKLLTELPGVQLTVLLSQYALERYLGDRRAKTLTETVKNWKKFRPRFVPLPHPSPRNNRWLKQNPWFPDEVLPYLKRRVRKLL